jgi:ribosomal-protein-alanine N-acetyltransferase
MPHLKNLALPQRLETERLFLRPYHADDAPWYFEAAQRNRLHLAEHEPANPVFDLHCATDAAGLLRKFQKQWLERTAFVFGVFLRETEEFAGQIHLGTTDAVLPSFNLGFFADCTHVNRGYVAEAARAVLAFAFNDLGAHRVGLWCDEKNLRSRRVAERCGFVREGHAREDKRHPDGTVTGSYCYGLLRREFSGRGADR